MRKLLPIMSVLVVIVVMAAPAPAQFGLTSLSGGTAKPPVNNFPSTVGVSQMLPKYNINNAMLASQGNSRQFNFAKLMPNFSFINNRWPLNTGRSQVPIQGFGANKK